MFTLTKKALYIGIAAAFSFNAYAEPNQATPTQPTPNMQTTPAPTGAAPIQPTAQTTPQFDCVLTDQVNQAGAPGQPVNSFLPTTAVIYFICQSNQVTAGQKINTVWIAADTNNAAPANYKIGEKGYDVTAAPPEGKFWTLSASVTRPTNNWPTGTYHVDLYVDGVMNTSVNFTIK